MGRSRRTEKATTTTTATKKSKTLPSSPSHSFSSSSSSDFEFTISLSPRTKSSTTNNHHYCPADELFYKGQLLPLHLSPRLSMVRTLLLASSSTSSSSDTTTTASRDSSGSSNDSHSSFTSADLAVLLPHPHSVITDCDSSRPSSVAEDDEFKRLTNNFQHPSSHHLNHHQIKKNKYFSLSRFSSVFRKDPKVAAKDAENATNSSVKRMSSSAKDVIRKYLKKVKPLYEKLSQKQQQKMGGISTVSTANSVFALPTNKTERSTKQSETSSTFQSRTKDSSSSNNSGGVSHSFSGNLRYPRRRSCVSSCPSSMRSSPSHSGVLSKNGFASTSSTTTTTTTTNCKIIGGGGGAMGFNKDSSMEELQSAIQGAIAHCKNSMLVQNKTMVSSSSNSSNSNEI